MRKRVLMVVLGALGLGLSVAAAIGGDGVNDQTITREDLQETGAVDIPSALALYQSDSFSNVGNSVLVYGFPTLTLLDGRRFLISGPMGRLSATDVLPMAFVSSVSVQKINASPVYGSDGPGGVLDMHLNRTSA